MSALLWDIYCRVIDNLGDAGVCWRLAANLAQRGQRVRLFIDDAAPLAFMAPFGMAGVEVVAWPRPGESLAPGDVVIEAFGCDPPPGTVAAMVRQPVSPVWVNLEYLSAEAYVERSHGLPSPQTNGLCKWFFFPGFTRGTGGLLREERLLEAQQAFDRDTWLQAQGITRQPGERVVSLFCYDNPALPALLRSLAEQPTLLLLTPGPAQQQWASAQQRSTSALAGLRLHHLPWLTQNGFDELLWAADLNFVRGEDSLVRAVWAGVPFVWQAYPQHDGAHEVKLLALMQQLQLPPEVATLWRAWNGLHNPWPGLPPLQPAWQGAAQAARQALWAQPDLASQLLKFVQSRQPLGC